MLFVEAADMLTHEQIGKMRRRLGLTQYAFGRLIGVARATVARWEIANRKPEGASAAVLEAIHKRIKQLDDRERRRVGDQLKEAVKAGLVLGGAYVLFKVLFGGSAR